MKNVVVTGASGFIGMELCRHLAKHKINTYAVTRSRAKLKEFAQNPFVNIIECDMANIEVVSEIIPCTIDVFYHLAWDGAYGVILTDFRQQIINIQYACTAIQAASELKCTKFIFAGTINELELLQFFNADRVQPRKSCIYGIAKLASDLMCKTLATDTGINYNTAVIGSCFGPGDRSLRIHNSVILNLMSGFSPKLIAGDTLHDWIYVKDVADMLVALGEKSINMRNYYIGHNYLRKLEDIVSDVRDIIAPSVKLTFGEIKTSFMIDYSLVDLNSVYNDTDYRCTSDFKECIMETARWLQSESSN